VDGERPPKLFVAGDSLSFDRLVKEVEAGLGAPMTVKSLGSFGDLDAAIKTRAMRRSRRTFPRGSR